MIISAKKRRWGDHGWLLLCVREVSCQAFPPITRSPRISRLPTGAFFSAIFFFLPNTPFLIGENRENTLQKASVASTYLRIPGEQKNQERGNA